MPLPSSVAFIVPFPTSLHSLTFSSLRMCHLHGLRLRNIAAASPRPLPPLTVIQQQKACAAIEKGEDAVDGEETLDEAAMRAAEIHDVLQGLQDFKDRIIDDATRLAKKVRAPRKQLEAALASHPDIIKIDGHIAELEEELRMLGDR